MARQLFQAGKIVRRSEHVEMGSAACIPCVSGWYPGLPRSGLTRSAARPAAQRGSASARTSGLPVSQPSLRMTTTVAVDQPGHPAMKAREGLADARPSPPVLHAAPEPSERLPVRGYP